MMTYLTSLQGLEQQALMGLVDRLRRAGLNTLLQLPQIVVCGDQSSGKSSVLEAISGIPFPRKENLCTRFATQIAMRQGDQRHIMCKINPASTRTESEQVRLQEFIKTIDDFDQLPSVIMAATELMGLDSSKAFSRDVLSIEVWDIDLPQLTLVDLPGLIHSASKIQSDEDVKLIKDLVDDYTAESRTIILAVVSAKNDYANQIILKRCREVDPTGARTLGVITKPDQLRSGTETEMMWLDLAKNKDIHLELGWHLLRNRKDEEHHLSVTERNIKEEEFFITGSYRALPDTMKGVNALRKRLSVLLYNHMKQELPVLKSELETMIGVTSSELNKLGQTRSSILEQRLYLSELLTTAWELLRMGSHGDYEHGFFGSLSLNLPITKGGNAKRLRAVVQSLNMQFVQKIKSQGHKYDIEQTTKKTEADLWTTDVDNTQESSLEDVIRAEPKKIARKQAIKRVVKIMERNRGRELFGTFNPMLICHLFKEESVRWEAFARAHVASVAEACKVFITDVLEFVSTREVKARLLISVVQPALKSCLDASLQELDRILVDKNGHAITYNHYFTDTLQKIQQARYSKLMMQAADEATVAVTEKTGLAGPGWESRHYISPTRLKQSLDGTVNSDMSNFSAEQVLDAHDAFYKDEMKYFVGVVTKQVVERHLIAPLAHVLSPTVLARLDEKQISDLVEEPAESLEMREHLSTRLRILEEGQALFSAAIGSISQSR